MLAVGGYAVELVAKPDVVAAYVLDASGKAQAAGDLKLQLQLGADAGTKLDLKWDAARASYAASLDAKLDLMAQPLRLALTAAGKTYLGATSSLRALAATRLGVRAQAGLEVPAPKLDAKLGASVQVPKPSVQLSAKKSASTKAPVRTAAREARCEQARHEEWTASADGW